MISTIMPNLSYQGETQILIFGRPVYKVIILSWKKYFGNFLPHHNFYLRIDCLHIYLQPPSLCRRRQLSRNLPETTKLWTLSKHIRQIWQMNSLQILNFIWLLNLNILENNSYGNNTQIMIMETIPNKHWKQGRYI